MNTTTATTATDILIAIQTERDALWKRINALPRDQHGNRDAEAKKTIASLRRKIAKWDAMYSFVGGVSKSKA